MGSHFYIRQELTNKQLNDTFVLQTTNIKTFIMTVETTVAAPADNPGPGSWRDDGYLWRENGYKFGNWTSSAEDGLAISAMLEGYRDKLPYPQHTVDNAVHEAREFTTAGVTLSHPDINNEILSTDPPLVDFNPTTMHPKALAKALENAPPVFASEDPEREEIGQKTRGEIERYQSERDLPEFDNDSRVVVHSTLAHYAHGLEGASSTWQRLRHKLPEGDPRIAQAKREVELGTLALGMLKRNLVPGFEGEENRDKALRKLYDAEHQGTSDTQHTRTVAVNGRLSEMDPKKLFAKPLSPTRVSKMVGEWRQSGQADIDYKPPDNELTQGIDMRELIRSQDEHGAHRASARGIRRRPQQQNVRRPGAHRAPRNTGVRRAIRRITRQAA